MASPYTPFDSLPQLLSARAADLGARRALTVGGRAYTYEDLWDRSGRVQAWLAGRGVAKGDNVALLMRNSIAFVDSWLALARMGAVAVPINTAQVGEALRHTLEHSGSRGLIADHDLLAGVEALGTVAALQWRVVYGGEGEGAVPYPELVDHGSTASPDPSIEPSDPMNIIYTSGTTGLPKGVVLSHMSYVNTGGYFTRHFGLSSEDVLHTCLPMFHCNAQQTTFMGGLHLGAPVALDEKFSLSRYWSRVADAEATVSNLLGSMLALLSKREPSPQEQVNTLRFIVAAPVPESLHRDLERRFGAAIVEGYGLTETGTMACINPPQDRRSGTIGVPLEHNELRIVDELGRDLPDGEKGELLTRSRIPHAYMTGYFREPEKTAEALDGGWFHTGDAVLRRSDGYYVFVDRIKDTIRRRGENISSFLVEKIISDHPEVLEVAAVGVASELSEQDVMVVVVRRPDSVLAATALAGWADPLLGDLMRPRYIRFVDTLPRTETGRVHKYRLRDAGTADAWDRERPDSFAPVDAQMSRQTGAIT